MANSIVVIDNQQYNIKIIFLNFFIKCDAKMAEFGFGHRYQDLKYFKVGLFFHIS
jgi:hypothetical protein